MVCANMAEIQQTLVLIKPDAIQRDLLSEIIARFERKGFKIIGMKFLHLTDAMLDEHYSHLSAKPFFTDLKKFMRLLMQNYRHLH